jgi:hypothetical protein
MGQLIAATASCPDLDQIGDLGVLDARFYKFYPLSPGCLRPQHGTNNCRNCNRGQISAEASIIEVNPAEYLLSLACFKPLS